MVDSLCPPEVVSVFGVVAVTAYYGLVDIAKVGPDDAVVIIGAAGAMGSVAVHLAKHVLGCRKVIGITGSDAKREWVQTRGANICLIYKSESFEADLNEATEGFVEVFFDKFGGEVLDLVLKRLENQSRVAVCGTITGYDTSTPYGIKDWYYVIAMRIQIPVL